MSDKLQGHHFATDVELRSVYQSSMGVINKLLPERVEDLEITAFTGEGLRQLAPEHVDKLGIGSGLVVNHCTTDLISAYFWPYADASKVFASVNLSLGPSEKIDIEWHQQRLCEESEMYRSRPAEGPQEEFEALHSAVFAGFLDREMGAGRWLQYEATALASIMKAIIKADPDHVRGMLCDPDEIY